MLWHVPASLDHRPGALPALAAGCGHRLVNILGLQIFPTADGRVVDELVLHTRGGWCAGDVEQLCVLAGVDAPMVTQCSAHALEDEVVRYLRAAHVLAQDPQVLEDQLCRLLGALPAAGRPGLETLVLDDGTSPRCGCSARSVHRHRARPSRGAAACRVDRSAVDPGEPGEVTLRPGTERDADGLIALHRRCSSETVYRRYHAPMPGVTARLARSLLEPVDGLSLLLVTADEIVAAGVLATGPAGPEFGVLVEDHWQRRGFGAWLVRALAQEAANRGLESVTCLAQPDNEAVLPMVHQAGLRARVSMVDGVIELQIPLRALSEEGSPRRRRHRPAMGDIMTPLVGLLHGRGELRGVYPAADLIDQAVRGGA